MTQRPTVDAIVNHIIMRVEGGGGSIPLDYAKRMAVGALYLENCGGIPTTPQHARDLNQSARKHARAVAAGHMYFPDAGSKVRGEQMRKLLIDADQEARCLR